MSSKANTNNLTEQEMITKFKADVSAKKDMVFNESDNKVSVIIEDNEILVAEKVDNKLNVEVYPDLISESEIHTMLSTDDVTVDMSTHRTIHFTIDISVGELLTVLKDAIININLYGYPTETN